MTAETERLRALAAVLENLEAAETWAANKANEPSELFVTWSSGSCMPGHRILQDEISQIVSGRFPGLLFEALVRLRAKVEEKRKALTSE